MTNTRPKNTWKSCPVTERNDVKLKWIALERIRWDGAVSSVATYAPIGDLKSRGVARTLFGV